MKANKNIGGDYTEQNGRRNNRLDSYDFDDGNLNNDFDDGNINNQVGLTSHVTQNIADHRKHKIWDVSDVEGSEYSLTQVVDITERLETQDNDFGKENLPFSIFEEMKEAETRETTVQSPQRGDYRSHMIRHMLMQ